MIDRKRGLEKRETKRVKAREDAYAVFRPTFTKLGQIIDISWGGLAFCYPVTGDKTTGFSELDIFLTNQGFYLERIPSNTISDFKIHKRFSHSSMPTRRCGVKFGALSPFQVSRLDYFIRNYTLKTD